MRPGVTDLDDDTIAFAHRMFDLARTGGTDELIANVNAGVPVNLTNDKGDTLLILAAYHRQPATVAALLSCGADPERIDDRGQSALAAAVFRQDVASVKALLAAGADPESARPTARFFELPDMLEMLDSHADVNP